MMIEIGLVNNLPHSTLRATERRYRHLLKAAAGNISFRLRCFSLFSVEQSSGAVTSIRNLAADVRDLYSSKIDGLIVTGAEPRAARLPEEAYWPALTGLVDWAEAAVLHLDGIERQMPAVSQIWDYQTQRLSSRDWKHQPGSLFRGRAANNSCANRARCDLPVPRWGVKVR